MMALRSDRTRRLTLGIIGLGSFGRFIAEHLAPHFETSFYDPVITETPTSLAGLLRPAAMSEVAGSDVVLLAMPVQRLSAAVDAISPLLRPGALVLDVCSVKTHPLDVLSRLPAHVDVIGTHPLFGPQSGKSGLAGLTIALVALRGSRLRLTKRFLERAFGLQVDVTTAERHDREMAHVQGLTHLITKAILTMRKPDISLRTVTYEHLETMVDMLRHDSDDLFRAICVENPYVAEVVDAFSTAVESVSARIELHHSEVPTTGRERSLIRRIA